MREGRQAVTSRRSRTHARAAAAALLFILVSSVFVLPSDLVDEVSAGSLPTYERVFHMHEGDPYGTSDYDWLNSTGPYNPGTFDYDGDGYFGVTIRKNLPSQRWRHFWVLDPPVNSDVRIQGDLTAHIWAASRDNESASILTITFSDMGPSDWYDPDSWPEIASASVPLAGPIYSQFKPYDLTASGVDYLLQLNHRLVITIMRGDSINDGLLILYDQTAFDSYIKLDTPDFIMVDELAISDAGGAPRSIFSDAEDVVVDTNVSNPFGAYEILDALIRVSYSGNGTVLTEYNSSMTLVMEDPSQGNSWKTYTHALQGLGNGSYTITVYSVDPQGSPSWLDMAITVIAVDHFGLDVPSLVTVNDAFSFTLSALDSMDEVIVEWMGIVYLETYLEDTVTPSAGSLSISSVTVSAPDMGQVVVSGQSYDYSEETILVRAFSGEHEGWSAPIVVASGPVTQILMDPPDPSIELGSGTAQDFSVTGTDAYGNVNTTWTPEWSVDGDLGTFTSDGFEAALVATVSGFGYVNCTNPLTGAFASVTVTVNPASLSQIQTLPSGSLTIREGASRTIAAYGYDAYGNPVDIGAAVWTTNTSGTIIGSGDSIVYVAGYIPETGAIEVSVGNVKAVITVVVTTALNGPSWLNTIPVQIASEDASWTLDLDSYWQHTNGTDELSWYAEGVNSSLYIVMHDTLYGNYVKFLTQPDKWGDDVFRLWIRDPDGFSAYQDIVVNILPVNDPPRFVNEPPTGLYVKFETPYSFDYSYYVKDVDTAKSALRMVSTMPGNVYFNRLIGTFLFPEKDGTNSYFEVLTLTVTDASESVTCDSTNSDCMSLVVRVTDDTPPSLNQSLPDVVLMEGDVNRLAFDLDDYFFDVDDDYLVYTYGFQNIDPPFINQTTHEVFLSATSEWSGTTDGTFTATDPTGALKTDTITVTVIPVNDPPTIRTPGTIHVRYDYPYYLDATMYVSDPDNALEELVFAFDTPYITYSGKKIELVFPASESGSGPFTDSYIAHVRMDVTDPDGNLTSCTFEVVVSDNLPPELRSPSPYYDYISFLEDHYLNNTLVLDVLFVDADDGEHNLNYTVEGNDNVLVRIYPDSVVNLTAMNNWSGTETVEFRAVDEHGAWSSWQLTVTVLPVNDAPVIIPLPDFVVKGQTSSSFDIHGHFIDSDTPASGLRIIASPESMVFVVGGYLYVTLPEGTSEVQVTLFATDSDGAESNTVTFMVKTVKDWGDTIGYPYSLPLVLLVAGLGGYFLASRIPRPFALQDVFLIHNDGRLIAHESRQESDGIDKDVVSAMFTAVQEFVRDSFQAGEVGLKKLEIGERNVVIEKGKSVYLAMIYSGWPPKDVFDSLTMLLSDVEERYKGRIERWNGTKKALKGVDDMLQNYIFRKYEPGGWMPEAEEGIGEEEWVDIISKDN